METGKKKVLSKSRKVCKNSKITASSRPPKSLPKLSLFLGLDWQARQQSI